MPRLKRCRRICTLPRCNSFGLLEGAADDRVEIAVEEYEAIRLIGLLGCTQEECAVQMEMAHFMVQQVYNTARRRLARAPVEGRCLYISGGGYVSYPRGEECPGRDCARRDYGMGRCGCGACLRSKGN